MKFFRFVGILLLIVIVLVVVLGIIEPKDTTVERSTTVNAPQAVVMDQITHFKNWNNWSPWYKMDPNTKMDYIGTDGEPGSGFHWVSDKTGEGTMTNAGVENGTMKYDLKFAKPKMEMDGSFKTEEANGQTKVTWTLHKHTGFPMNAMNAFMSMDKMMGPDFESGLKGIKEYAEAHANDNANVAGITETQFPGHLYCGVRKLNNWSDMSKFFMDTYPMLGKELNNSIRGAGTGLYWTWDTVKHQTDMAAVFPVADSSKKVKGTSYFNIPASSACMITYTGPYSGMMAPHTALMKYCASKNMKVKLVIEEYLKSGHDVKDSTQFVTAIYYLCDGMAMADASAPKK
jgi:effector-binding domain-containing protein